MSKHVLDVGNCVPDHSAITQLVEGNYDAKVSQTHGPEDTLELMQREKFDLVLVNRKLDRDYTDGLDIIKQIKANPAIADVPVMLLTNFKDHQQLAVEAGAELGFGKLEYELPETHEKLSKFLGSRFL